MWVVTYSVLPSLIRRLIHDDVRGAETTQRLGLRRFDLCELTILLVELRAPSALSHLEEDASFHMFQFCVSTVSIVHFLVCCTIDMCTSLPEIFREACSEPGLWLRARATCRSTLFLYSLLEAGQTLRLTNGLSSPVLDVVRVMATCRTVVSVVLEHHGLLNGEPHCVEITLRGDPRSFTSRMKGSC